MSLITGVEIDSLLVREPMLVKNIGNITVDLNMCISEAKREILQYLKNEVKKIRLFCTPLSVYSGTASESKTYDLSEEDVIERMILLLRVIDKPSQSTGITLVGSNDKTTVEEIFSMSFTEKGFYVYMFDVPYKYYALKKFDTVEVNITLNLVESSFYLSHLYLSLALAFKSLIRSEDDMYSVKFKMYMSDYESEIDRMLHTYDSNEDGSVSIDNEITTLGQTVLLR